MEHQSSNSLSSEYSGLISFRIDWFDLTVQGTLKSLLQHHSLEALILRCSAFSMVQLSPSHNSILGYIAKENEKTNSERYIHININSSLI